VKQLKLVSRGACIFHTNFYVLPAHAHQHPPNQLSSMITSRGLWICVPQPTIITRTITTMQNISPPLTSSRNYYQPPLSSQSYHLFLFHRSLCDTHPYDSKWSIYYTKYTYNLSFEQGRV